MNNFLFKVVPVFLCMVLATLTVSAQGIPSAKLQSNPWTTNQLLQPSVLAGMISKGQQVRIYNIGVVQDIKGAVHLGAASEKQNLERLNQALKKVSKNETIVLYCGCCPMDKCPNIRPAFKMLTDLKFTRPFLLNLPVNLKTDWTDKGYPLARSK